MSEIKELLDRILSASNQGAAGNCLCCGDVNDAAAELITKIDQIGNRLVVAEAAIAKIAEITGSKRVARICESIDLPHGADSLISEHFWKLLL